MEDVNKKLDHSRKTSKTYKDLIVISLKNPQLIRSVKIIGKNR